MKSMQKLFEERVEFRRYQDYLEGYLNQLGVSDLYYPMVVSCVEAFKGGISLSEVHSAVDRIWKAIKHLDGVIFFEEFIHGGDEKWKRLLNVRTRIGRSTRKACARPATKD